MGGFQCLADVSDVLSGFCSWCYSTHTLIQMHMHAHIQAHTPTVDALHQPLRTLAASKEKKQKRISSPCIVSTVRFQHLYEEEGKCTDYNEWQCDEYSLICELLRRVICSCRAGKCVGWCKSSEEEEKKIHFWTISIWYAPCQFWENEWATQGPFFESFVGRKSKKAVSQKQQPAFKTHHCVQKQTFINCLLLFVLCRFFLDYFYPSLTMLYQTLSINLTGHLICSSQSTSTHFFLVSTYRHIPAVYRLLGIQFVPQKCPGQFWSWSAGEMGLLASWKKTSDCLAIAARFILVYLNS